MRRIVSIFLFLALCPFFPAFAQVIINTDQTDPVLLGTHAGPETAKIIAGVTVETTGTTPPYAVEVHENITPTNSWTIDNYGTLLANTDDSVHCYTDATVNNYGKISSRGGGGSGVAAVFSDDSINMDLNNTSTGYIDGTTGVGVVFEFYGVGNTGSINNQGKIVGGTIGVQVLDGNTTLINSGTITGLAGPGVVMSDAFLLPDHILINSGTIIGNDSVNSLAVSMGGGDDIVELQTGTRIINGDIDGRGNTGIGDTLILNGSGAVIWGIYWFENLEKKGSGRWTLETDLDLGVSGNTDINAGDLGLNADLISGTVYVNASGTLSGDASIFGDVDINFGGTISPGNGSSSSFGTLAVTGNVDFFAGSTMAVDIGAQGTGDFLYVGGTAALAGTIRVNEVTAIPDGGTVTVIAGGTFVSGTFGPGPLPLKPGLNSFIVSFLPVYNANDMTIQASRNRYSDYADTDNQWQVAEALYDSVGLSTGDLGRVLAHLDFLPLQDLQSAFEELQPKPYTTHPSLVFEESDFYRSIFSSRLRDGRKALLNVEPYNEIKPQNKNIHVGKDSFILNPLQSTGDGSQPVSLSAEQSRWSTYAQPYALWAQEKSDTAIEGYEAYSYGALFGTDGPIGKNLIGGLCAGIGVTKFYTDDSASHGNNLSLRAGPYLSYFKEEFILEASVTGSVNWLSNERPIDITGLSRSANGFYDSYDLAAELAAIYGLEFWGFTLAPELRLVYDYLYMDDFEETGADSISLVVFDRHIHSLNHVLGARLGYDFEFEKSTLRPEAWVAWTHKYLDGDQDVQASLSGAPQNDFTITAPGTRRDILNFGGGMTLSLTRPSSLYLHYQAEVSQDTWNHSVQGGLQFRL